MIALQITAHTPHGIVLSQPWGIALDGLLASVLWHRRKWAARAAGHHLTYQHHATPETIDLPLARCGDPTHDSDWHWMATFADLHPHSHDTIDPDIRWRTAHTDHNRLQQLAPTIGRRVVSDRKGRYQNRIIPVIAHPATLLTWRAVGDPDTIADLLDDLPLIGKHRGVGEGLVTHWHITETSEIDEWAAGHEHEPGILGRTTPLRCLTRQPAVQTGPLATAPIRPPYLHPETRTAAYHPAR
ncbi:hypothetical protein [Mycobacterium servetii]|uniref:Uncharacterized protein n=1 Tax=Mycobacterium servetii TaxID=3237418 RepID=A0ABV4C9E5_9MYCO